MIKSLTHCNLPNISVTTNMGFPTKGCTYGIDYGCYSGASTNGVPGSQGFPDTPFPCI